MEMFEKANEVNKKFNKLNTSSNQLIYHLPDTSPKKKTDFKMTPGGVNYNLLPEFFGKLTVY